MVTGHYEFCRKVSEASDKNLRGVPEVPHIFPTVTIHVPVRFTSPRIDLSAAISSSCFLVIKMINNILAILRGHPLVICGVVLVLYALFNRYGRGLSRFNGPFLASLTSLWGVWHVWATADRPPYVHLHKKYGHVVRLSPNKLSFAQPAAIRDIYGPNGLTQKSDLHLVSK